MADEKTKNLLAEWKLEKYVSIFEDNAVTSEVFVGLDDSMLKELIPSIGDRALFKIKRDGLLNKNNQNVLTDNRNTNNKRASSSGLSPPLKRSKAHASDDENLNSSNNTDDDDQIAVDNNTIIKHFKNIKGLLKNSEKGKNLVRKYNKTNKLQSRDRTFIVDVIISELSKLTKCPKNVNFETIGKFIVDAFSASEILSTYYIAPVPSTKQGLKKTKSIPSRGKLVNKWRNYCTAVKVDKTKDKNEDDSTDGEENDSIPDPEIKRSLEWLNDNPNTALIEIAKKHWKVTEQYRKTKLYSIEDKNIVDIFEKLPILKQPNGYEFIQSDFEFLNLTKFTPCIENWNHFYESITNVVEISSKNETVQSLENILCSKVSDDNKVIVQLLLLAHYIPSKATFKIKVDNKLKHWKITIGDTKDSMVQHVVIDSDIEKIKQDRITFSQTHKQTLQPYIIVVGEKLGNISSFFVCLDKVLYKVNSALEALDLCFKLFHVFNLKYPLESKHIWQIIQKSFYKFETKFDEILNYTEYVIVALNKKNADDVIQANQSFDDTAENKEDEETSSNSSISCL